MIRAEEAKASFILSLMFTKNNIEKNDTLTQKGMNTMETEKYRQRKK